MNITQHSKDRGKERMGLSNKAFERIAEKAFEKGWREKDFKECNMKKYLAMLFLSHQDAKCGGITVYGEFVYIFTKNGLLKTVLNLPSNLKNYKAYLLNEENSPKEKSKTFEKDSIEFSSI